METLTGILRFIHITNAMLMIWPFYALVAVNQRGRLGPPLGDRVDVYMENIIKNRTIPCFVFQATALISGAIIVALRGRNLADLFTEPILAIKFFPLLLIGGLLTYVHVSLQPRIDALFAQAGGVPATPELAKQIGPLRIQRKRLATICLFVVLLSAMFGVQVWAPFPFWLTLVLTAVIGLFTWRSYSSVTPYGWA
jgi:hypothetical protein